MPSCQNNLEKSYTEKKIKQTASGYYCLQVVHLMQQKTNLITKVKTVWKCFVQDLKDHAVKIIN